MRLYRHCLTLGGGNRQCSQNTCSTVHLMMVQCPLEQPLAMKVMGSSKGKPAFISITERKKRSKSTRQLNSLSPAIFSISKPEEAFSLPELAPSANTTWCSRRLGFAASPVNALTILTVEALARMLLSSPLSRTAYDPLELGQEEPSHRHACF